MRTRKFLTSLIPALPMLLTALLVILVTVIFLTAMRSKAHAQFGGVEQPIFPASIETDTSITNDGARAYYWNYQDLADGLLATDFTDRVQGLALKKYYPTKGPLKNSTGLWFTNLANKETLLTNAPLPLLSNALAGIIFRPTPKAENYNVFVGMSNAVTDWVLYKSGGGSPVSIDWHEPASPSWAYPFAAGKMGLVMWGWSNSVIFCWTNGVFSKSVGVGTMYHPGIQAIGGKISASAANNYLGSIQELVIFTNLINPAPWASNYWFYATNTYGFTP